MATDPRNRAFKAETTNTNESSASAEALMQQQYAPNAAASTGAGEQTLSAPPAAIKQDPQQLASMNTKKSSLLLGGEDDMDVDEDLPLPSVAAQSFAGSAGGGGATVSSALNNAIVGGAPKSAMARFLPFSTIISPSPYPHHNSTSSRFRNALQRVLESPDRDIEAWQALLTEVQTCAKGLMATSSSNGNSDPSDTAVKLDWIESCYGYFFRFFPYAYYHAIPLLDLWMAQSVMPSDNLPLNTLHHHHNPLLLSQQQQSPRAQACEAKLEGILCDWLGLETMDGTVAASAVSMNEDIASKANPDSKRQEDRKSDPSNRAENFRLTGICSWVVELWMVYVKKRTRDAHRHAVMALPLDQREAHMRQATQTAYETALPHCGFSHNNQILWKAYLDFVKSWTNTQPGGDLPLAGSAEHAALLQQQRSQLRSVYQRLVAHPMTGLDQFWHEYEAWERGQSEALAQALAAEFAPKYQHARTVYLERNRVYHVSAELQLGTLRPPPEDPVLDRSSASATSNPNQEDYENKLAEEDRILKAWKKRCSYERTNPERLSASELSRRIRTAYKEMATVMTRFLETWHMWSTYELYRNGKVQTSVGSSNIAHARAVLQLGQEHIPDSVLLPYAEAHLVELYSTKNPSQALNIFKEALDVAPTTLGFVLYQQMVRRYHGMQAAREVFRSARRILAASDGTNTGSQTRKDANSSVEGVKSSVGTDNDEVDGDGKQATKSLSDNRSGTDNLWVVTNRLDASVGKTIKDASHMNGGRSTGPDAGSSSRRSALPPGPITWHLYAAHAAMEHRLNRLPDVAARVYELGLRKHASFLTKPAYVLRYAQLLLELGDAMNLRALLTCALSACEGKEATGALWDMMLHFETVMSGNDASSLPNLEKIERQRREALFGPELEDVGTGGYIGVGETPLIGAQKASIADHLVRTEGYDLSSSISSGLSRSVDVLEVMGLWGTGTSGLSSVGRQRRRMRGVDSVAKADDLSGGKSDCSFQQRLDYCNRVASGLGSEGSDAITAGGGSRLLSARERLQQTVGAGASAGAPSAIMLAIQQMPDWLRPLLLLLPASRLRLPVVAKPPPHMVEMTLNTLRQNELPAERPVDAGGKRKIGGGGGGDSSDEENGARSSGYGNTFRARQRARMTLSIQPNGI